MSSFFIISYYFCVYGPLEGVFFCKFIEKGWLGHVSIVDNIPLSLLILILA